MAKATQVPTRTFEYCSLQYLNQWITRDSTYCIVLSRGTEDEKLSMLHDAAVFYRISRNLPRSADVGKGLPRYKPLIDVLDSIKLAAFEADPIQGIREAESAISDMYDGRGVLSLTTKVLWLKLKSPIIIYDRQPMTSIQFLRQWLQK